MFDSVRGDGTSSVHLAVVANGTYRRTNAAWITKFIFQLLMICRAFELIHFGNLFTAFGCERLHGAVLRAKTALYAKILFHHWVRRDLRVSDHRHQTDSWAVFFCQQRVIHSYRTQTGVFSCYYM